MDVDEGPGAMEIGDQSNSSGAIQIPGTHHGTHFPNGKNGQQEDDYYLSSSAPGDGNRNTSRLARKAESARQARLRHKQFVTDLQEQAATLQARIGQLETHCTTGPGSATVALKELKSALKPEQLEQLTGWLREAQGENHVLARYENGTALPPPIKSAAPMGRSMMSGGAASSYANGGGSAPIAIGGAGASWRGGASASPMESDEGDGGSFPMSRSWDDCEVARSILNLNSPNGFHPLQGPPMGGAPDPFSLGGGGGSLPPMMPSHQAAMGSMLGVQRNRAS